MPILRTIGYEGASLEDLIATLRDAGVECVIDVREAPYSKRKEFSSKALEAALKAAGIGYASLPILGNPKAGREAAKAGRMDDARAILERHLAGPEAGAALAAVAGRMGREALCLLCFERDPARCHRSRVASALAARAGTGVVHLMAREGAAPPAQLSLF